jgi:dienelactone hydrolase
MAMRTILAAVLLLVTAAAARAGEPVSFPAGDGATVYGEIYRAAGPAKAVILLFHQAGANRGEYAPIAPRLAAMGYDALAIDQRAGGTRWGQTNQTVAARGQATENFAALPDLEGTLAYAQKTWPGKPVIAWGSSYSASLVFFLAAWHPDQVAAVLSFSPGEYFDGMSVRDQAAKTRCPVFISSASDPEEIAEARRLYDAVPGSDKTDFVPRQAVHGSAALRPDLNPAGAPEIWSAVAAFLNGLPASPK